MRNQENQSLRFGKSLPALTPQKDHRKAMTAGAQTSVLLHLDTET